MKMKCFAIGLFLCFLLVINSQVLASSITVSNSGFEDQKIGNGAFASPVTGWSGTSGIGAFNPTTGHFPDEAPEGDNIAYVGLAAAPSTIYSLTQTTTHSVILGQTYVLQVEVGHGLTADFPGYTVALLAGGNPVSTENALTPTAGTFLTSTVSWTADSHAGDVLGIRLSSANQTYFDDVRLDAVPIPSALWLLGSGLIGIVGIRRKFKS